jgi:hypothetical protein
MTTIGGDGEDSWTSQTITAVFWNPKQEASIWVVYPATGIRNGAELKAMNEEVVQMWFSGQ